MLTEEALRPALRHQIAHFCPDLEAARKCIRTCIKQGKPAFCGKDHNCYCGHKYGPDDSNKKQNPLDVYKQFSDMYAKYLGIKNIDYNDENRMPCYRYHKAENQLKVDMDYYLSYLRNTNCYSKEGFHHCEKSCQNVPVVCHDGECYCHQSVVQAMSPPELSVARKQDVQIKISAKIASKKDEEPETMLTEEALRPALRHQIAHFCPDLEAARKCIRTCIKQGKPAFCGKDHNCYCGHKYGPNDSNNKQNALDVYKQFSDMYAKYLGIKNIDYNEENRMDTDNKEKKNDDSDEDKKDDNNDENYQDED